MPVIYGDLSIQNFSRQVFVVLRSLEAIIEYRDWRSYNPGENPLMGDDSSRDDHSRSWLVENETRVRSSIRRVGDEPLGTLRGK